MVLSERSGPFHAVGRVSRRRNPTSERALMSDYAALIRPTRDRSHSVKWPCGAMVLHCRREGRPLYCAMHKSAESRDAVAVGSIRGARMNQEYTEMDLLPNDPRTTSRRSIGASAGIEASARIEAGASAGAESGASVPAPRPGPVPAPSPGPVPAPSPGPVPEPSPGPKPGRPRTPALPAPMRCSIRSA